MTEPQPSGALATIRRAAIVMGQGLLSILILLDEIVRPIYRPLTRWISERRVVALTEAAIGRLPPYAVLALLAVPFAVAEPLKLVGVVLIGRGQIGFGALVLILSYLASFLIVERIYHAGRAKLMTIGWFAKVMNLLAQLRAKVLDWLKASPVYIAIKRTRDAVRNWWRGAEDVSSSVSSRELRKAVVDLDPGEFVIDPDMRLRSQRVRLVERAERDRDPGPVLRLGKDRRAAARAGEPVQPPGRCEARCFAGTRDTGIVEQGASEERPTRRGTAVAAMAEPDIDRLGARLPAHLSAKATA